MSPVSPVSPASTDRRTPASTPGSTGRPGDAGRHRGEARPVPAPTPERARTDEETGMWHAIVSFFQTWASQPHLLPAQVIVGCAGGC
ncbi:hypothetical protein GCM10011594_18360 [Nakamurella endophytica]|uniref:Uncharacterized protein n=1 Tax=Nakamurella endophytica TaxID=1748367 RepID=A0A917WER7_9ACTN|nr:hypothetical protein GCM10011594_18360 [Nakamurella endophytica]